MIEEGRGTEAAALLRASGSPDTPTSVVLARALAEGDGDVDGAVAELELACERAPQAIAPRLFSGIYALDAADRPQRALEDFDSVIALQPANDLAHAYRALALLHLGRDDEALQSLREHGFSDNRAYLVRLTEWAEMQWLVKGRFFAPTGVHPPELTQDPLPQEGWFAGRAREKRIARFFYAKDFPAMLRELAPYVSADPPDDEALFLAALGAEMLGGYEFALDAVGRLLPPDDLLDAWHTARANSSFSLAQYQVWNRSAETDSALERLHADGSRFLRLGSRQVGRLDPFPDHLLALRGRCLVRMARFDEAAWCFNRTMMIGPEDFGVNYYLGVICLRHGDTTNARACFRQAYTTYHVDTLEYQLWQLERALISPAACGSSSR